MAEDKLSSYIDLPAVKQETEVFLSLMDQLEKKFDKLNDMKLSLEGLTKTKDVVAATKAAGAAMSELKEKVEEVKKADEDVVKAMKTYTAAAGQEAKAAAAVSESHQEIVEWQVRVREGLRILRKERDALRKSYDQGSISEENFIEALKTITAEEEDLKVAQLDLNRALRNMAKEAQASEGSVNKLRAQLNLSLQAFDRLSDEERASSEGKDLEKRINDLTAAIKKEEEATQRFQRNVGNYQGSAKIIVDAFEKAQRKVKEVTTRFGEASPEARAARKEFEDLQRITENPQFLKVSAKYGDSIAETRYFTKALLQLEQAGEGNKEVAAELKKRLAQLTDEIGDTRAEIKALSSDTRSFDLFASAVSALSGAVQTGVGIWGLFADSEEEVAEVTKALMAVQTGASGIQALANELTTKGTAANKLYTWAQIQLTTATDAAAAATARLKAALASIGIGLLIIGIGLVIANFGKLKQWLSSVSKEQQLLNDINKEALKSYTDQKVAIDLLVDEVNDETTSKRRKKEIIEDLNKISPVYFGHIKTEKDLIDEMPKAYDKYIAAILAVAKVKAAEARLQENEQKRIDELLDSQDELSFRQKQLASLPAALQEADPIIKELKSSIEDINKEFDETGKAIMGFVRASKQELDKLGGDPTGSGKDLLNTEARDLLELQKIKIQAVLDANNRIASDEEQAANSRIRAMRRAMQAEINLVQLSKQQQLLDNKLSASERTVIEAKAAADIFRIQQESQQKISNFQKEKLKEERQAQHNLSQFRSELALEAANRQADDERKAIELRLFAANKAFKVEQAMIAAQRDFDLQNTQLTESERTQIREKARADELNALQVFNERTYSIALQALDKESQIAIANSHKRRDTYLKNLSEQFNDGLITREVYENRRREAEFRYANDELNVLIDLLEQEIAKRKEHGEDVIDLEAQIAKLREEQSAKTTEKIIGDEERLFQERMRKLQTYRDLIINTFSILGELTSISSDKEMAQIDEQIAAIDKKKEKDIEYANKSIENEEEKAARISVIEARAEAQRQAAERRKRQIEAERARFEKLSSIAKIITDTSLAVMSTLKDDTIKPSFLKIPLAATMAALGAAQLARVIATPIPKYAEGTDDHPGGPAVVGDGGRRELVVTPEGQLMVTDKKPQVLDLPKHSVVLPDADQALQTILNANNRTVSRIPYNHNQFGYAELAAAYNRGTRRIVETIQSKREVSVHGTHAGVMMMHKHGQDYWNYINEQVNF